MRTDTPRPDAGSEMRRDLTAPLFDIGTEDGMSTDARSANQLPAEQQLLRFLQWLQFTDRGHQPC